MFDIVSPVIWMSEISRYKKELRHPQPHPNNQIMISLFCWHGFLILYTVCSEYLVACLTDDPGVLVPKFTLKYWYLNLQCGHLVQNVRIDVDAAFICISLV